MNQFEQIVSDKYPKASEEFGCQQKSYVGHIPEDKEVTYMSSKNTFLGKEMSLESSLAISRHYCT